MISVSVVAIFVLSSLLTLAVSSRADTYWEGYLPQDSDGTPGIIDYDPNPMLESRVVTPDGSCEVVMNAQLQNCYWHEAESYYECDVAPVIGVDTLGKTGYLIHQSTDWSGLVPSTNVVYPALQYDGGQEIVFGRTAIGSPIFTFMYYGVSYDRVYLSENGYITLGQSSGISLPYCQPSFPYSEGIYPNGVVAPLWMDIGSSANKIWCGFSSTSWPVTYSIAWWDVSSDFGTQRFVLSLREDGVILFDYLSVNVPAGSALIGYEDVIGVEGAVVPLSNAYSGSRVTIYPTPESYQYVDSVFFVIDKRSGDERDLDAAIEFMEDPANPDRVYMPGFNLWTLDPVPPEEDDESLEWFLFGLDSILTGADLAIEFIPILFTPQGAALIFIGGCLLTIADFWLTFAYEWEPPEGSTWDSVGRTEDASATAQLYAVDEGALPEGYARPPPTNFFCMPRFMWRIFDEDRSNDHSVTIDAVVTIRDSSDYNPLDPYADYVHSSYTVNAGQIEFEYNYDQVDLTVTSPAAGTTWTAGSQYTIGWMNEGTRVPAVDIYLYKGDSELYQIIGGTDNDGSFAWTVPPGTASGSDYRIKIVPSDPVYSGSFAYSSYFSIFNSEDVTITVTSPDGGDEWWLGTWHYITWTSQNVPVGGVDIWLAGYSTLWVIADDTENDGSLYWQVPYDKADGSEYCIIVQWGSPPQAVAGISDYFTIGVQPLKMWSKYDESSGTTAVDSSGNGVTGTLYGVEFYPGGGASGGCVYSNGDSDDRVNYGNVLDITGDITISCWVKTTSTRALQWLVTKSPDTGYGRTYDLELSYNSSSGLYTVSFVRGTSDGSGWLLAVQYPAAFAADGSWHFIAARHNTYTGSYGIRVDNSAWGGTLAAGTGVGTAKSSTAPLQVGNMNSGGGGSYRSLVGLIDEPRIWNQYVADSVIDDVYGQGAELCLLSAYDESSGTAAVDSSGNGVTGTLYGVEFYPGGGASGGCVYSNGDSVDRVDYGNVLDITGDITISCWVKTTSTRALQWLVTKSPDSGYGRTYDLDLSYISSSGLYTVSFVRGTSDGLSPLLWVQYPAAFAADGSWHFIAARHNTYTGSYGIRVDNSAWGGTLAAGTGVGTAKSSTAPLQVGNMNSGGGGSYRSLVGLIDEPRIWNQYVADSVIDNVYGQGPELCLWSRYDESSGTTASDSSGNVVTGTLYGVEFNPGGGASGGCVYSNGDSVDRVDYGNVLDITGDITISCWVKTTSTRALQWLVTKSPNTGFGRTYDLELSYNSSSGLYTVSFVRGTSDGSGWLLVVQYPAAFAADGSWHFIAARHNTYTGSYGIRVDNSAWGGTLAAGTGVGAAKSSTAPLQVGNMNSGGGGSDRSLVGLIDEVQIWDRCLADYEFNQLPTASFTAAVTYLTVDVDGSESFDSDGTITTYAWDWGDGTYTVGGIGSPAPPVTSHTYAAAGTYTIRLTVRDNDGAIGTKALDVTVTEQTFQLTVKAYYFAGKSWKAITSAWVKIDGILVGVTGGTFTVSAGEHTVEVQSSVVIQGKTYTLSYFDNGVPATNGGIVDVQSNMSVTARYLR